MLSLRTLEIELLEVHKVSEPKLTESACLVGKSLVEITSLSQCNFKKLRELPSAISKEYAGLPELPGEFREASFWEEAAWEGHGS